MKNKQFYSILLIIVVVGLVFRFWNYSGRFGLAYDQAHDVLVAREAIRESKLPLVGPFSSAGPFQTSGTWYWLIMAGVLFNFENVITPWIFITAFCSLLIVGMALFGKYLEDEHFGLIAAAFTAISTAQITQSINLTNQTPIPIFSFLTIVCAVIYLRKKTMVSAIGLGFFSSMAASIHLQGMALAIVVFWTLLFSGKPKIIPILAAIGSAFLPILPILIWDASNDNVNVKNMIYYYTKDQFNISLDVLGRRWLTYLTEFWPREWAHIIGGTSQIAIGIILLGVIIVLLSVIRKKIKKEWILILISFVSMATLVRYMRVPIFASFITFMHPFVLLLTTFVVYRIFRFKPLLGVLCFICIITGSFIKSYNEAFLPRSNWTAQWAMQLRSELTKLYPDKKFSFYDHKYDERHRSVPIALYFDEKHLIDEQGIRIGFIRSEAQVLLNTTIVATISGLISDLDSSSSAQLLKDGWISVNPASIYKSTEEWR